LKNNLRILFLNHNFEGFGTYFRCLFLGKYLATQGHKVTILCASKRSIDLRIVTKRINENFEIITLPRIKFHPYHSGHILRAFLGSAVVLLKDFDVLHSFSVAQPSTALPTVVCKLFRKKLIVVDWDDDWSGGLAKFHPFFIRKFIMFLERNIPRLATKVTVVSDYLKDRALSCGCKENNIEKIPNGANIKTITPIEKQKAREHLGFNEKMPAIVSMGHSYMGIHNVLFDVFSKVLTIHPEAKLYLVGNSGLPDEIKNKYFDLLKSIVFVGEVPSKEVIYYLAASDVLMLPMGNSNIEQARWPIRFGDYLASGRPIVSNAVGEVKKIIEEYNCGIAVSPNNIDDFAKAITNVIDDCQLQEQLGKKARRVAEDVCSWEHVGEKLNSLYQ